MKNKNLKIYKGMRIKLNDFIHSIVQLGYDRDSSLSNSGIFSVLGGAVNIFPINSANHIRVDFFGDEVDSITESNKEGRSLEKYEEFILLANRVDLTDGSKIKPGDYVVHEDHGVGIFVGLETKNIEGECITYIIIKYLNDDLLRLPAVSFEKLSFYIGVGRKKPRLSKLGSATWQKTYKKTYKNIFLLAKELLLLYAKREVVKRPPLKINQDWNNEVVRTFGYVETEDQKKAINEVFKDLQGDNPMDRLICGDVGFGKTEVAIRAAVQACANGFQVAILVPTTILCEQHYVTLVDRLKKLPLRISHLSRFINQSDQSKVMAELMQGKIDIVVGTHKLFSQNLKFKNLGLLIIDEEQKFGVKDKEKLKHLKTHLNVLTLTATPIPRTLFMGLSGLRDISLIGLAPKGRREIDTIVKKYDESLIKEFIEREASRKGQVYYLHNKVNTINGTKNKIQKMFSSLMVEVAHGQMGEVALAKVMRDFTERKIDILVCSTIIENGLDLPNVNTLIVENSDKFGLSQLYQIRGRIGRSPRQAYALFTYNEKVTPNAFKRLKALSENTELGSGYNIALSDLEIRGGGNILGREQHGSMEAVGLVLYTKLLNKAVEKLKKTNS